MEHWRIDQKIPTCTQVQWQKIGSYEFKGDVIALLTDGTLIPKDCSVVHLFQREDGAVVMEALPARKWLTLYAEQAAPLPA